MDPHPAPAGLIMPTAPTIAQASPSPEVSTEHVTVAVDHLHKPSADVTTGHEPATPIRAEAPNDRDPGRRAHPQVRRCGPLPWFEP